jgi:hypothetical protein
VITAVVAEAILLPLLVSVSVAEAVTELLIVAPLAVDEGTCTTIVNTAVSPAVTADFEKTIGPEVLVLQPVPVVTTAETRLVPDGTASLTVTVLASLGPLLAKLIV